eukprot:TRINITY_DN17677_c0_g1_i1.p1 TRINITY_DN17677_c0_g1~~TRINITY_DN17677_c0_g1_i1.p1  ORF type:complete len:317 (-),score=109.41 TRINITY_DN17677_c0_g1_i1:3-953(-)
MSCLPSDAFSHFEKREQELLALDQKLEEKRAAVLAEASDAVRDAASSSLHSRVFKPPTEPEVAAVASAASTEAVGAVARQSPPAAARPSSTGSGRLAGASLEQDGTSGSEALHTTIRFQNARIVALQEELDKTLSELSAREGEVKQLQRDLKQVTEERQKLQKSSASGEQSQEKARKQAQAAETKVADLEREVADLRKERDQSELQRKRAEADCSKQEAKLNRLAEECDKYKAQLKEHRSDDKDRAVADRRETDRLTSEVRKLERQRAELVAAFKKQMKLIEVLKRQRAHVEAARVLSFTEDEFIRVLELGDRLAD